MQKNSTILFFCPSFYSYHLEIIAAQEKEGYHIIYFDEKIANVWILDIIRKRIPKFYLLIRNLYEKYILWQLKDVNIQKVFVIKSMNFSLKFLTKIMVMYPNAERIMYNWDSIRNFNYLDRVHLFNKVFSFDRKDCKQYSNLIYKPLFYLPKHLNIRKKREANGERDIDVLFLGDGHGNRLEFLNEFYYKINTLDIKVRILLLSSLYGKFKRRKKDKNRFLITKKPTENELKNLLTKTRSVVDIPAKGQSGLTIRSIESLGSHIKLITTNDNILNETFYSERNILILKIDTTPEEIRRFLSLPFNDSIDVDHLFISNWIKDIFN